MGKNPHDCRTALHWAAISKSTHLLKTIANACTEKHSESFFIKDISGATPLRLVMIGLEHRDKKKVGTEPKIHIRNNYALMAVKILVLAMIGRVEALPDIEDIKMIVNEKDKKKEMKNYLMKAKANRAVLK